MTTLIVDLPEDVQDLFATTPLAGYPPESRVRIAIAIVLYQQGAISIGRAAEIAQCARIAFEELLWGLQIPVAIYSADDAALDARAMGALNRPRRSP